MKFYFLSPAFKEGQVEKIVLLGSRKLILNHTYNALSSKQPVVHILYLLLVLQPNFKGEEGETQTQECKRTHNRTQILSLSPKLISNVNRAFFQANIF